MTADAIYEVAKALKDIAKEINGLTIAIIKLDERIEDTNTGSTKCMKTEQKEN
jgi:hypothetical protein